MQFLFGLILGFILASPQILKVLRKRIDRFMYRTPRREAVDRNQQIVRDWKSGMAWQDMIDKYKINRSRLWQILAKQPDFVLEKAKYIRQDPQIIERNRLMANMFAAGNTYERIGEHVGLAMSTARGTIHRMPNYPKLLEKRRSIGKSKAVEKAKTWVEQPERSEFKAKLSRRNSAIAALHKRGLSHSKIADKVGVSQSTVSRALAEINDVSQV